jgi:hypothetical protein
MSMVITVSLRKVGLVLIYKEKLSAQNETEVINSAVKT